MPQIAGLKGDDPVLLIKIPLLQSLHDLSDHLTVEEMADFLSFRKFLNLQIDDLFVDETKLFEFGHRMPKAKLLDHFLHIEAQFAARSIVTREGSIIMGDGALVRPAVASPPKRVNAARVKRGAVRTAAAAPRLDPGGLHRQMGSGGSIGRNFA